MTRLAIIRERAERRKGGATELARLLPARPDPGALANLGDDRILAEMARRIFCAGFVWKIIEAKWPGFEEAFLEFDPAHLLFQPDEFWEALTADRRIVRNAQRILAVRANAAMICDLSSEHGGFGKFLSEWPSSDQIGLMELLAKRGSRLGGATGQYLLRFVGWDGFVISRDVSAALRDAGLDIAEQPTSKRDLARIQAQFNAWADETGLPYSHLSRIAAMSIGPDYPADQLLAMAGGED